MEIPTYNTQMKIAELLHDHDGCQHLEATGQGLDNCWHKGQYVTKSAFFLGKLMFSISTEMFPAVRADEREKLAYYIRAECGGWAAQLAQDGPEQDRRGARMPCVVQGGTESCRPAYYCPVSRQNESPCHGGFDNCCTHPDLHGPVK